MKSATLAEAQEAKEKLSRQIADRPDVNGIGVARARAGYAVKVNLIEELSDRDLPSEVDGVPVKVEVVGTIKKRTATKAGASKRR